MGTVTVTVEGKPVEQVIDAEVTREIADVRTQSTRLKIRRPSITRPADNVTHARSGPVRGIENIDPRTTHVIICGIEFEPLAKAPFITSGQSLLGLLEENKSTGALKCHECGEWFIRPGRHIAWSHPDVGVRAYKIKHGLSLSRGLATPVERQRLRDKMPPQLSAFPAPIRISGPIAHTQATAAAKAAGIRLWTNNSPESANLVGKCRAQTERDGKQLYAQLGRTPTRIQLLNYRNSSGLHTLDPKRVDRLYGSVAGFFACIGIANRRPGHPTTCAGGR